MNENCDTERKYDVGELSSVNLLGECKCLHPVEMCLESGHHVGFA